MIAKPTRWQCFTCLLGSSSRTIASLITCSLLSMRCMNQNNQMTNVKRFSVSFTDSTRLAEGRERQKACDLVLVLFHLLNLRGPDTQRTGTRRNNMSLRSFIRNMLVILDGFINEPANVDRELIPGVDRGYLWWDILRYLKTLWLASMETHRF